MRTKKTKVCVCAKCIVEDFCADNEWSLYDPDNKKCPNYKAGMKQHKQFLKEEIRDAKCLGDF